MTSKGADGGGRRDAPGWSAHEQVHRLRATQLERREATIGAQHPTFTGNAEVAEPLDQVVEIGRHGGTHVRVGDRGQRAVVLPQLGQDA